MAESKRNKIKEIEVMVAEVVQDTHDTTTLVLFTGNDRLDYQPGHFLTINPRQFKALERWVLYLEDLKGKKEPPRAYSLASSPDENHLAITVKEETYTPKVTRFPPLLSPILAKRTPVGTRMTITGFTGPYTLPKDQSALPEEILHICAGSGIVPNWSLLKYTLRNHPSMRHTLLYSNKTWADTIYGQALLDLQAQFPDRLKIVFSLTREDPDPLRPGDVRKGRIGADLISQALSEMDEPLIYVCGPGVSKYDRLAARKTGETLPPRFLESTLGHLADLEIPRKRIKRESYG